MGNEAFEDPRAAFAAALTRLRRQLPDVSDEVLARRASLTSTPSGRRVAVYARRLGEWLGGRSVPRDFDAVTAVVRAMETAIGRGTPHSSPGASLAQWRQLWRTANEHRVSARATETVGAAYERIHDPADTVLVGRPPGDAAALRERTPLARQIDAALGDSPIRQVLLTGAGGVGKSQLASAAFHRARYRGGVLVWVPASTRQSVLSTYARAWRAMSRVDAKHGLGGDDETQADLFVAWLRATTQRWLVVLDDVDDPADLGGLWPTGQHGRSIVTTRRRDAALIRPATYVVSVGMFAPDEAVAYLRSRLASELTYGGDDADLAGLASALGHFPLALSQAAAFLIDSGMGIAAYRQLLDDQRASLSDLFPPSSPADEHHGTVTTTWQLAMRQAETLARPGHARAMLQLGAMLSPDGIPEAIVLTRAARQWLDVDGDGATEHSARLALRALHRLNLVTHDPARQPASIEVHALVQRATRESVPESIGSGLAVASADAVEEVWARSEHDAVTVTALYSNIEALRRTAGDLLWDRGMHPVMRRIGQHLSDIGRPAAARDTCLELLEQARIQLGDGHRDVLALRRQVARAIGDLGEAAAAHAALAELRQEAERVLGSTDPDTLHVRFEEANFRLELGDATVALPDLTAIADDTAATLGPLNPVTVNARRNAALGRGLAGDAAGARDEYAALVHELERHLSPRHPIALTTTADLGRWIGEAGDPLGAVETHQRAVDGLESVVGRLHHDTIIGRQNLAYLWGLAGRPDAAIAEFTTAADDAERALGAVHPTTLTIRANLAFWRGLAGDPAIGLAELTALQPAVERIHGTDHPRTLRTRQQRAQLRELSGDRGGAVADMRTLLSEMTRVQGPEHPRTREVAELLASWSRTAGT